MLDLKRIYFPANVGMVTISVFEVYLYTWEPCRFSMSEFHMESILQV